MNLCDLVSFIYLKFLTIFHQFMTTLWFANFHLYQTQYWILFVASFFGITKNLRIFFESLKTFHKSTPVTQKVVDGVVFRRFQGQGVEFLKSGLTDPPSDF